MANQILPGASLSARKHYRHQEVQITAIDVISGSKAALVFFPAACVCVLTAVAVACLEVGWVQQPEHPFISKICYGCQNARADYWGNTRATISMAKRLTTEPGETAGLTA